MRAGTWATVIAILIIVAVGWWAIDWTGEDTVPVAETPVVTETPPAQQQGEVTPSEQTVGEPPTGATVRPAD